MSRLKHGKPRRYPDHRRLEARPYNVAYAEIIGAVSAAGSAGLSTGRRGRRSAGGVRAARVLPEADGADGECQAQDGRADPRRAPGGGERDERARPGRSERGPGRPAPERGVKRAAPASGARRFSRPDGVPTGWRSAGRRSFSRTPRSVTSWTTGRRRTSGRWTDPAHRHAYLERPRGHSKTGDLGTEATAELVLAPKHSQLYCAAADRGSSRPAPGGRAREVPAPPAPRAVDQGDPHQPHGEGHGLDADGAVGGCAERLRAQARLDRAR